MPESPFTSNYTACSGEVGDHTQYITTDTTWALANSPYHLEKHVEVNPGVTLTVEPGVQVLIGEKLYIHVCNGASVIAKGAPDQRIAFDRYIDPITHLGPRWCKIWFHENTASYFRYVDFGYAGASASSDDTTLHFEGAGTHVLNNCTIRASKSQGIVASGDSLNLTVAGTLFEENNVRYPIIADSGANLIVTGSTFNSGGGYAVYLRKREVPATISVTGSNLYTDAPATAIQNSMDDITCVSAQSNWWGATNGPYDSSSGSDACGLGSNAGWGVLVSDGVDYRNWRTSEAPLAGITTPPVAAFTVDPNPTIPWGPGTVYTFDASDSTDAEDHTSFLEICWDWNNDDTCNTVWTKTKTATHIFPSGSAVQKVRLVVRDTDDLTADTTREIVLNSPPTASFTLSPGNHPPQVEGTVYTFDASGSSDAEDQTSELEVRWDWDNDDDYETSWTTNKTITHSFAYADGAIQTVRLAVRDTTGSIGEDTRDIYVLENPPPTAAFTFTQPAWNLVHFDASASTDDKDAPELLQVAWDYEGDGVDTDYSVAKTISYTYPHLARYWPTVYVKDTGGQVGLLRKPLDIIPPTAAISLTGSDTLTSTDGTVRVAFYTDTVAGDVISNGLVITHTPWLTLPQGALKGIFTYQGFNLSAQSLLSGSQPLDAISGTYTITISYDDSYLANVLRLPFEDKLELYHWSGADWIPVDFTLKTAEDQIVATVDFFGDFALVMDARRIYMPLLARSD